MSEMNDTAKELGLSAALCEKLRTDAPLTVKEYEEIQAKIAKQCEAKGV